MMAVRPSFVPAVTASLRTSASPSGGGAMIRASLPDVRGVHATLADAVELHGNDCLRASIPSPRVASLLNCIQRDLSGWETLAWLVDGAADTRSGRIMELGAEGIVGRRSGGRARPEGRKPEHGHTCRIGRSAARRDVQARTRS